MRDVINAVHYIDPQKEDKVMLENLYTTKMSMDKEKLQKRFSKIRSKNGKWSKLMSVLILAVILLIIAAATVIIAGNVTDDRYIMTDEEFEAFAYKPIGSIMAELDYADDEKIVFHYLEGFFVVDQQTNEVIHKINLSKLNVAPHSQGEVFLNVGVDKDGKFAYLFSQGNESLVKKFDEYVINLETGEVKKGKMPKDTKLVPYAMATYPEGAIQGWYDPKTFVTEDKSYLLTASEYNAGALQLVIIHNKLDMTGYRYVFGDRFTNVRGKKLDLIKSTLADDEELIRNSGLEWTVDGKKVLEIYNKLAETTNFKYRIDADLNGEFGVYIYEVWNNTKDEGYQSLFIIDNADITMWFHINLTYEVFYDISEILSAHTPTSDLYNRTRKFLEGEFHRVYDPYYDIQTLTISDWNESGNEATFWYKMTYLNYNREPDKAEYIQEAKKRSQKEYETLYRDYLALKESNNQFKVVYGSNGFELYYNASPKGTEWQPVKIDDFIGHGE